MTAAASLSEDQQGIDTRRRHARTNTSGEVKGEVAHTDSKSLIGQAFTGGIIEVSPCGLRIETDLDICEGTLEMWADLDGYERRIFLSTEIRWSECVGDGVYHVGVEIVSNPLSDIDHWCEFQREQWFLHKQSAAAAESQ